MQAPGKKGRYQYIRMEFCDGGDLEEYIRRQPDGLLPVETAVLPFLFQMAFALFAGQREYSLRHFDVKVLRSSDGFVVQLYISLTAFIAVAELPPHRSAS